MSGTVILILVGTHVATFVAGALVFRNNSKEADKIVATIEDATKKK